MRKYTGLCVIFLLFFPFLSLFGNPTIEQKASRAFLGIKGIYLSKGEKNQISSLQQNLQVLAKIPLQFNLKGNVDLQNTYVYKALGWLHGWAAMSKILNAHSAFLTDWERESLLSLNQNSRTPSCLALLLQIYQQLNHSSLKEAYFQLYENKIHRLEQELQNRPLQDRPALRKQIQSQKAQWKALKKQNSPLHIILHYGPRWWRIFSAYGDKLPTWQSIVGRPQEKPRLKKDLFSLWQILYLQLDTWHQKDSRGRFQFSSLIQWLEELGQTSIHSHLTQCARRFAHFLRFRQAAQDPKILKKMVKNLYAFQVAQKLTSSKVKSAPSFALLKDLWQACQPVGKEYLYSARIWKAYLFWLVYSKESLGRCLQSLPKDFSSLIRPGMASLSHEFSAYLRWNQFPYPSHPDHILASLLKAAYGYLQLQKEMLSEDENRLKLQLDFHKVRFQYIRTLQKHLQTLQNLQNLLRPYGIPYLANPNQASSLVLFYQPIMPFLKYCTSEEARRLGLDIRFLLQRLQYDQSVIKSCLTSLQSSELDDTAAVWKSLATAYLGIPWNPYTYPTLNFHSYQKRLQEALKKLQNILKEQAIQRELRQRFVQAANQYHAARLEVESKRLAFRVSQIAFQIASIYSNIAKLEKRRRRLAKEMAQINLRALQNNAKAREKALKMADEAYVLAKAELDGIEKAYQKVAELIQKEKGELQKIKKQLQKQAQKIKNARKQARRKKKISGIFRIIRALTKVIGIALAPFTDGQSLSAAMILDQVLNMVEQAEEIQWKSFTSVFSGMLDMAQEGLEAYSLAVQQWGDKKAKENLKNLQESIRTKIQLSRNALELGHKIYQGVKRKDFLLVMAALANDMAVKIDKKNKKLLFQLKGMQLAALKLPKQLEENLKELLKRGAIFVQNVKKAKKAISNFPKAFQKFLKDHLRSLPMSLLAEGKPQNAKTIQKEIQKYKQKVIQAFQKLSKAQQKEILDLLRKSLQKGRFLALRAMEKVRGKVQHQIVVVKGKVLQKLKDIVKYQKLKKVVSCYIEKFQNYRKELAKQAERAQKAKDDRDLSLLAEQVQMKIQDMEKELEELEGEIQIVKEKVQQEKNRLEIAGFQEKAAKLLVKAQKLKVSQEELFIQEAQENLKAKYLELEKAELYRKIFQIQLKSEELRLQAAREAMLYAWERCLEQGVDPLKPLEEIQGHRKMPEFCLYQAFPSKEFFGNPLLREIGTNLWHMVQWIGLLDPSPKGQKMFYNLYREMLTLLAQFSWAGKSPKQLERELEKFQGTIRKIY
ncbi:MAG: hypothetical protein D6785_08295, partial [Planctomycetota bacterium]